MGERHAYASGTFSFVELACHDVDEARRFYGELLGWEASEAAPGGLTMMRLGGRDAAAIDPVTEGEQAGWISYVTVADAHEVAETVPALGGHVLSEPADVPGAGRTATIADPHGAQVALWEPRGHAGAGVVNDPGAFCWNELAARDVPVAERFWGELLDWSFRPGDELFPPGYRLADVDGRLNAGLRHAPDGPSRWVVYFTVESITDACDHALEMGATLIERPQPLYAGTFASLADRQACEFALWEGDPDP